MKYIGLDNYLVELLVLDAHQALFHILELCMSKNGPSEICLFFGYIFETAIISVGNRVFLQPHYCSFFMQYLMDQKSPWFFKTTKHKNAEVHFCCFFTKAPTWSELVAHDEISAFY